MLQGRCVDQLSKGGWTMGKFLELTCWTPTHLVDDAVAGTGPITPLCRPPLLHAVKLERETIPIRGRLMTVGTHDRGGIPAHPDGACSAPNVGVLFPLKNSAGACDVGMGRPPAPSSSDSSRFLLCGARGVASLMTAWFHADGRTLSTGDALLSVAIRPWRSGLPNHPATGGKWKRRSFMQRGGNPP